MWEECDQVVMFEMEILQNSPLCVIWRHTFWGKRTLSWWNGWMEVSISLIKINRNILCNEVKGEQNVKISLWKHLSLWKFTLYSCLFIFTWSPPKYAEITWKKLGHKHPFNQAVITIHLDEAFWIPHTYNCHLDAVNISLRDPLFSMLTITST